ncbi:MAG TPA: hypothetical protein VNI52_14045 [Sphingobacteriaceae bacterium]|nr:hypothetical protein [Sphingobacteriaceae bacterium]
MEKVCLDCGTVIKGRSDKKFCDDQCRSNYNNRIKSDSETVVKQINAVLKKNRQLLQKHNPEGKARIKNATLQKDGFNFNYHTHTYETQKGSIYYFCYEYGYLMLENDLLLLVKREEI